MLGRVKGLALAMLVFLRVAPVPLRAFDPSLRFRHVVI
jgi:hypothetical protein